MEMINSFRSDKDRLAGSCRDKDYCSICGQDADFKKLFTNWDYEGRRTYAILECNSCKVKKTDPFPENIGYLYENDKCLTPRFHWLKSFLVRREIRQIVKLTNSKQFLEIGSGDGEFSESLNALGYYVVASDASQKRPYYLEDKTEVPYIHFDYERMEIDDQRLVNGRTIVLRHVLEHIEKPAEFLKGLIHQNAKFFYIVVPNVASFERKIFGQYDCMWCLPQHLWHYDIHSLGRLFELLGLKLVSFGYEMTPTIAWHIRRYMIIKKFPRFMIMILDCRWFSLGLSLLLNIFFRNNVLWALVESENKG